MLFNIYLAIVYLYVNDSGTEDIVQLLESLDQDDQLRSQILYYS